jgi:hypothetical protein
MKMWVSKYALGDKGRVVEAEFEDEVRESGYAYPADSTVFSKWTSFKVGSSVHHSREDAVAAAEAARKKKIASLQKQIKKLESMKIE